MFLCPFWEEAHKKLLKDAALSFKQWFELLKYEHLFSPTRGISACVVWGQWQKKSDIKQKKKKTLTTRRWRLCIQVLIITDWIKRCNVRFNSAVGFVEQFIVFSCFVWVSCNCLNKHAVVFCWLDKHSEWPHGKCHVVFKIYFVYNEWKVFLRSWWWQQTELTLSEYGFVEWQHSFEWMLKWPGVWQMRIEVFTDILA